MPPLLGVAGLAGEHVDARPTCHQRDLRLLVPEIVEEFAAIPQNRLVLCRFRLIQMKDDAILPLRYNYIL